MSHQENFAMSHSYNDLSKQQQKALIKSFALIDEYLVSSPLARQSQVTLADYGCSEGLNSLEIIEYVIRSLKKKNPSIKVNVFFEDLESNSWETIFKVANKNFEKYDDVFFAAVGKSFYQRNFHDKTVDFAFSGNAFHWASRTLPLKDGFLPYMSRDMDDIRRWRELSLRDWNQILQLRSAEIKPGGIMFANFAGTDETSRKHQRRQEWIMELFKCLRNAVANNIITEKERSSLVIPVHVRLLTDLVSKDLLDCHGFVCLSSKVDNITNPYLEEMHENVKRGQDPKEAAKQFAIQNVGSKRAYGEYFYRSMLDRPEEEKAQVLDRVFQPLIDAMAQDPLKFDDDLLQVFIVLQKVSKSKL